MAISLSRSIVLVAAAVALVGCSQQIMEDDAVMQAREALQRVYPDCTVDVKYKGVGEGDADNAYVLFTLEAKAGDQKPVETEVLFSRASSDAWEIPSASSERLADTIRPLCEK